MLLSEAQRKGETHPAASRNEWSEFMSPNVSSPAAVTYWVASTVCLSYPSARRNRERWTTRSTTFPSTQVATAARSNEKRVANRQKMNERLLAEYKLIIEDQRTRSEVAE